MITTTHNPPDTAQFSTRRPAASTVVIAAQGEIDAALAAVQGEPRRLLQLVPQSR